MIKAVVFDADGVLIDNTKVYIRAYKETGRKLGLKIPSDSEIKEVFGLTWDDMLASFYGKVDGKMKRTLLKICIDLRSKMKIMDGLEYVLKNLKFRKAIAASKSKSSLKIELGSLIEFFEVIITREDTKKPNPEPLLLTCKKLGIKPGEAVYVGDAVNDFKAARNAGMSFIGFRSGATTKKEFDSLGVKSVNSMKELLRLLQ